MKNNYKKCGNYPSCTFTECECHFRYLMNKHSEHPLKSQIKNHFKKKKSYSLEEWIKMLKEKEILK